MIHPSLRSVLLYLAGMVSLSTHATPWGMVQEGQSTTVISLSSQATPVEHYAAEELQRVIEIMSGAKLEIIDETSDHPGDHRIIIATAESAARQGLNVDTLGIMPEGEQLLVKKTGTTLYLIGGLPRSALYATYAFLEEVLGARWYWPSDSGEYIPVRPTLQIEDLEIVEKPSLKYRGLALTGTRSGYDEDTDRWMARNRMNVVNTRRSGYDKQEIQLRKQKGFLIRIAGHNVTIDRKILEQHPEYLAEFGGKRQFHQRHSSHLCWANPEVLELIVQKIAAWWDNNPEIDIIHFYPADQMQYCSCADCLEMAPDVSSRWQLFVKQVLERLHAQGYDGDSWSYAYQGYRDVPQSGVAPLGFNGYALYNINYRALLGTGDPVNQTAESEMITWQELGSPIGVRGYEYIIFNEPIFVPLTSFATAQMSWLARHGMSGYLSELRPYAHPKSASLENTYWTTNRMTLYASAKAMWNAETSAEELVRDWTHHVFGPAGEAMSDYYWLMEDAWRNGKKPISYFTHPAGSNANQFITDQLLEQVDACFAKARELASTEPDEHQRTRILEQLSLESTLFNKWRTLYRIQQGQAAHYTAHVSQSQSGNTWPLEEEWEQAATLPDFIERSGEQADAKTEVALLWNEDALYLKITAFDSSPTARIHRFHDRDSNVWADDSIELFINTQPETNPGYYHLALNTNNARYDAVSLGGLNPDTRWDPEWQVKTEVTDKGWNAYVKLPFSEFGGTPALQTEWQLAVKRTRPGRNRANSGWPDASYHNPGGFGTLRFVLSLPGTQNQVLLYDNGYQGETLQTSIEGSTQMQVIRAGEHEAQTRQAIENKPGIVVLKYGRGQHFELSESLIQTTLTDYLKQGGVVLISAVGKLPLQDWFPQYGIDLKWSGWAGSNRSTVDTQKGPWMTTPHKLATTFRRLPPSSGYYPIQGEWESLASLSMSDQSNCPYLLRTPIGQGKLYVTTSNLGYGGGYEIFGNRRPENAARLIENLSYTGSIQ